MKKYWILLVFVFFISCKQEYYNRSQFLYTNKCFLCYEALRNQLLDSSNFSKLDAIKQKNIRPYRVKDFDYGLIKFKEFENLMNGTWLDSCYLNKISLHNDLIGIKVPSVDVFIIEIDNFKRHNLSTQYSDKDLMEYHRLVLSDSISLKKVLKKLLHKNEKIVYNQHLDDKWIYLITQIRH